LKEWSRTDQGNLGQRKSLLEKLAAMENITTDRGLTEDEATKKASLLLNLEDLIQKMRRSTGGKDQDNLVKGRG